MQKNSQKSAIKENEEFTGLWIINLNYPVILEGNIELSEGRKKKTNNNKKASNYTVFMSGVDSQPEAEVS